MLSMMMCVCLFVCRSSEGDVRSARRGESLTQVLHLELATLLLLVGVGGIDVLVATGGNDVGVVCGGDVLLSGVDLLMR